METIIDETDKEMYADSAYSGEPIAEMLAKKEIRNLIHEKGYRNHPLTEEQKESNRKKSKIRVRVEHVFGFMRNSMNGITVRCIVIERVRFNTGFTNLLYNIHRYCLLCASA